MRKMNNYALAVVFVLMCVCLAAAGCARPGGAGAGSTIAGVVDSSPLRVLAHPCITTEPMTAA